MTTLNINFKKGIDTKTDPWQISIDNFLSLQNTVFQKGDLLTKRPGYATLSGAPSNSSYLTTLNGNLLAIGDTVSAESQSLNQFISKGNLQPCSLSVAPIIRNNLNQIQTDSVITNGLLLITYTQQSGTNAGTSTEYFYAIQDAETEQNIVAPTLIPALSGGAISGSSRVFVIGRFFLIISPVAISGVERLQYVSIPVLNPTTISPPQDVFPEAYVPISGNPGWDGAVGSNNTILVAYNTTAGGQGVHISSLTEAQIASNSTSPISLAFTSSTDEAALLTMCVDVTVTPNIYYIAFYNSANGLIYSAAVFPSFGAITTVYAPKTIYGNPFSVGISNLASAAQNNLCSVFFEISNSYSYDSSILSDYIQKITINSSGTVGASSIPIRSVGLASKAFIINGIIYFLCAYQSPFQPSYFLINGTSSLEQSPVIVAKLAYQNGGGYLTLGLPSVTVQETTGILSYLYKQDVEALNTISNPQQTSTGGIYSQLGINLAFFDVGTVDISSSEIAQDLHFSGGYLSLFDGYVPVEHNFFLFPDSVEATYTETSTVTPTGTFLSGSTTVTVSSATGIAPGMSITDTSNAYIPAGTTVVSINSTTLIISQATTHAATSDNLSIQGNIAAQPDGITNTNAYFYQAIYEWTDSKGNPYYSSPSIAIGVTTAGSGSAGSILVQGPMLRLTQKISNPVKIALYRWSVETEVYNQVTSIVAPLMNSTIVDSWSFVDTFPDSEVVGNNIIYTTGGVVPDTNGPATNIMTIFDTRLCLVPAEDPNQLWISKTVIENTPVEMSLDFTVYIAPNVGTTQTSGGITSLFPLDDKLILFKRDSLFYMNGTGPDNLGTTSIGCPLGNYSQPTFISSVVGCTNQKSIVLTPGGLMFQSDKGIWLLGHDLSTQYIGAPVEAFNSFNVTSAQVIPATNYVLFTLNTNTILMYDYYYGQWGTWTGTGALLSSCIYNNLHTILTEDGQILQQTPNAYVDASTPVLISLTTAWINLASLQGYQRFYEFYILGNFLSPHEIQILTAYDYNSSNVHSSTLTPLNYSSPTPSPFGVPTPFGSVPQVLQWRIHAKQQLCQSFQLTFQEVFNEAYNTTPGAGFTLSGINCSVLIKKATRPIRGANQIG